MHKKIRILIFEDNTADAELIKRQLRKSDLDFKVEWAVDKKSFISALDEFVPDIILADYSVPGLDGLAALKMARERFADIPGIIVSGAIGEEFAVQTLKSGATDYVLKDSLSRLGPAVKRAIREAGELAEKKDAQAKLRYEQEISAHLLRAADALARSTDLSGVLTAVVDVALQAVDHSRALFSIWDEASRELRVGASKGKDAIQAGTTVAFENASTSTREAITKKQTVTADFDRLPKKQRGTGTKYSSHLSLVTPVIYRERVVGLISVDDAGERRPFSEREIAIIRGLASQAASAIENARLHEQERESTRLSEALNFINSLVADATLSINEIMQRVATEGARALHADACRIALLEDDNWVLRYTSGLPAKAKGRAFRRMEMPAANIAYETGRPVAVDSAEKDDRVNPKVMQEYGVRSLLAAPLTFRGKPLGVTFFDFRRPLKFTQAHVDFTAKLAASVSLALENAALFEELKRGAALSSTLTEIDALIHSTLAIDQIMAEVLAAAVEAIGCEAGGINLRRDIYWERVAVYGLPKELLGERLTDDQNQLAALVAMTSKPVIINDTSRDDTIDQGFVKKYSIKSGMVFPLTARDQVIGVIFFHYKSTPVGFSGSQIDFAAKLASSLALGIENARLFEAEHRIAGTLQASLLTVPAEIPGLDIGHVYASATDEAAEVGGDFYDVFELEHNRLGIVIGDVVGKGVEAATLTALVKNTVRAYAYQRFMPASVMAMTNDVVHKRTAETGAFVTLFVGVLDTDSGVLSYANAGHPPPIIKTTEGVQVLETRSPVIGVLPNFEFLEGEKVLYEGETLVLYTDGVTEARQDSGFFGEERLVRLIADLKPGGAKIMTDMIFKEIMAFTGGNLVDDTALLVLSLAADPPAS